ncbi:MAG: hypothetical protein EOP11_02775 [Proteobacteria bacterium]|nr:MAG: hypothetical protein EOP11_02775 [Pseudomonadota bacterium]
MKAYALVIAMLLLFAGGAAFLFLPQGKELQETALISAGRDQLRYENYRVHELMGGSQHVISLKSPGQNAWLALIDFPYGDPFSIKETNFRLVPLTAGRYAVLLGWKMAISPPAGSSEWIFWDAGRDLEGWECCNYRLLKDVSIDANGRGTLTLNPIPQRAGETQKLETTDAGRSWHRFTGL